MILQKGAGEMPFFKKPSVEQLKANRDIKGLIKALRDKSLQADSADALVEMGEEAIKPLIEAFSGYGAKSMSPHASILVRIGEPAVQPLIEALQHYRWRIRDERRQASLALAEIGDERAVKTLCWARSKEPSMTGVTEFIVPALRKISKPPYQALFAALEESDKDVRLGSIETLWEIAKEQQLDVSAVEPLSRALQDTETKVRQIATYALGEINDEHVVEPLRLALEDRSWFVRDGAKNSLKRVQGKLGRQ
jgi:bilin biosynthesis protein